MPVSNQTVLFLCTGNYYRSRYAEALFNHEATRLGLGWQAFSRGLQAYTSPDAGFVSPDVSAALSRQRIPLTRIAGRPTQVTRLDFMRADRVIALSDREHRPMMQKLFPDLADAIHYWHVSDIDVTPVEEGLVVMESRIRVFTNRLRIEAHRAWIPIWEADPAETRPVPAAIETSPRVLHAVGI